MNWHFTRTAIAQGLFRRALLAYVYCPALPVETDLV
jgi:hypothetical protein